MSRSPRMGNQQTTNLTTSNSSERSAIVKKTHISSVTIRGPIEEPTLTPLTTYLPHHQAPFRLPRVKAATTICAGNRLTQPSTSPKLSKSHLEHIHRPSQATAAATASSSLFLDDPCHRQNHCTCSSDSVSDEEEEEEKETVRQVHREDRVNRVAHHSTSTASASAGGRLNPISSYFATPTTETSDVLPPSSASAVESLDSVDVSICSSCNCNCNNPECCDRDDQAASCQSSDTFASNRQMMKQTLPLVHPHLAHHHHHQQHHGHSHHQNNSSNISHPLRHLSNHHSSFVQMNQVKSMKATATTNSNSSSNITSNNSSKESKHGGSQTHLTDPVTQQEIKFTQIPGCTVSTFLCLLCAVIFIILGTSSGIYYGLQSFDGKNFRDRVFKGSFVITHGESYKIEFENAQSSSFKKTSIKWQQYFNRIFNSSKLTSTFKKSEVVALERAKERSDDVAIHFNLHFVPVPVNEVNAAEIYIILANEFLKSKSPNTQGHPLSNISIDHSSLDVTERREVLSNSFSFPFTLYPFYSANSLDQLKGGGSSGGADGGEGEALTSPVDGKTLLPSAPFGSSHRFNRHNPWESRVLFPGVLEGLTTEPSEPLRRCQKIDLLFCAQVLPYNWTSYPNLVGHCNSTSVIESLIEFRQIIDAECYPLAREFICRILQPECQQDDQIIYPCRDFCNDFKDSCGKWIDRAETEMNLLLSRINCQNFPSVDVKSRVSSGSVSDATKNTPRQVKCAGMNHTFKLVTS